MHAGAYAFAHRRDKKGDMRRLWNVKLNAGLRPLGISYSKFIGNAKKKNIDLDRKSLAYLAEFRPELLEKVVALVK
jgi:large subunit ribosomal protein L20